MHGMAAHLALLAVDNGLGNVYDPLHLLRRLAPAVPHRGLGVDQLRTAAQNRQLGARRAAAQRGQFLEDDEAYLAVQHHLEVPGAAAVLVESYTYVLPELHLQRFRQRIRVSVVHSNRSSAQLSVALAETEDLVLLNEGWRAACARLVASAAAELNGQSGERHRAGEI